jgi:hypothetical protein
MFKDSGHNFILNLRLQLRGYKSEVQVRIAMTLSKMKELATAAGLKLIKPPRAIRSGRMLVRYLLRDRHGVLYFQNLDDVECYLRKRRSAN